MSDLIDRMRALDELKYEMKYGAVIDQCGLDTAYDIIKDLPSAEPEQKWIPVTKALPENDDWVIVSIYDDDGDTSWQYTTPGFYVPYGKCWIVDNEYCKNVIAWMPLPKPAIIGEVNDGLV